jgi:hypothetical protein
MKMAKNLSMNGMTRSNYLMPEQNHLSTESFPDHLHEEYAKACETIEFILDTVDPWLRSPVLQTLLFRNIYERFAPEERSEYLSELSVHAPKMFLLWDQSIRDGETGMKEKTPHSPQKIEEGEITKQIWQAASEVRKIFTNMPAYVVAQALNSCLKSFLRQVSIKGAPDSLEACKTLFYDTLDETT